jgi:DNA helicase-2/ATP-dependent DNA helicase PcrA
LTATRNDGPIPVVQAFENDSDEAKGIARSVRDHHGPGSRWSGQAVLVRTNAQIPAIEEAFTTAQIPFRVRGAAPLLEQPEIKAALAEMRRATGPFEDALADLAVSVDSTEATGDRAEERRANVDALVQLGRDYVSVETGPSMPGFYAWLAATTRADQPDRWGDAVEITTFHAAKGLEWPIVHLGGIEQGLVPIGHAKTGEALSEELRLFYVAITRAERELVCSWAGQRRFGTKTVNRNRSAYLDTVVAASAALRAGTDPVEVGKGVSLSAPPPPAPTRRSATRPNLPRPAKTDTPAELDEADSKLFLELRSWRSDRAKAASMPAFVICNDRTLTEIAANRPGTTDELLEVHGFGEIKATRFGDEILAIVAQAD